MYKNAINHPGLGMVHIPTINMVMTGGWFMALSYPHYEYDRLVMSNIAIENETFIVSGFTELKDGGFP